MLILIRIAKNNYLSRHGGIAQNLSSHGITYFRFGEFSQSLARAGAELLSFPSAFTVKTGMAHWEPLLRWEEMFIITNQ